MNECSYASLFPDCKNNASQSRKMGKWNIQRENELHIMFILPFTVFLDSRLFLKTLGYLFSYLWE